MIRALNSPQIEARFHSMVDDLEKTKKRIQEVCCQVEQFDSIKKIDEILHLLDQFVISTNQTVIQSNHLPSDKNDCHVEELERMSNQLSVRQLVYCF